MSTPAKLVPEGTSGAPAAAPDPGSDADVSAAVAATLSEAGVERSTVEGPGDSVTLPARGADGKFTKPEAAPAAPAAPAAAPETKPAAAAAPAASAAGADEADLDLTAEQLAIIEKHPEMRQAYKLMRRALTRKFEEVAEQRRAAESDINLIAGIRKDPVAGLIALATALNLPLPPGGIQAVPAAAPAPAASPVKTPLAIAEEKLGAVFPPEGAKALAPILVEIAKAVAQAELEPALKPIRSDLELGRQELQETAQARQAALLSNAITDYGRSVTSRGDDWSPDIAKAMSELVGRIVPGKQADGSYIPLPQYLDILYNHVAADRSRRAMKARQLERLRAAEATAEPTPARSTPTSVADRRITPDMSNEEADALAVQQTLAEMGIS